MKDSNSQVVPDDTLSYSSDDLSGILTTWNKGVANVNFDSINIQGTFSSLIDNGVATEFFNNLSDGFQIAKENCSIVSTSLAALLEEQNVIDTRQADKVKNITSYARTNSKSNNVSYTQNDTKTEENKDPGKAKSEKDFIDNYITLDEYIHVSLITFLKSISNGDLKDLLYNDEKASFLKEQLLKCPSLPEELREIIFNMDEHEVQVTFRNILSNGSLISDFSVAVIRNDDKCDSPTKLSDMSENVLDTYSKISYETIQDDLNRLYNGDAPETVTNETIYFTRSYIDTLATFYNVDGEDICTNTKYINDLTKCTADLIKTFSYIEMAKGVGIDVGNSMCSRIMGVA